MTECVSDSPRVAAMIGRAEELEARLEEAEVQLQEQRWEKERKMAAWAQLEERFASATAAHVLETSRLQARRRPSRLPLRPHAQCTRARSLACSRTRAT